MVSRSRSRPARGLTNRREFLAVLASLAGCSSKPKAQAAADASLQPVAPAKTRLIFGGDVMLSRYVGRNAHQRNDPKWPFREIAPAFESADIAFINLESPFTERKRPFNTGMIFGAAPDMVEGLRHAGIDVVSTANNHARDGGKPGVEFTLQVLKDNGIAAVGTGLSEALAHEGVVLQRNGIRFGFLAYTHDQRNGNYTDDDDRVAVMDIDRLRDDLGSMRLRADVSIVSMHDGVEYRMKQTPHQTAFARAAIDAGASIVVGHHPHVVQPVENYKGGVIFYSLGNLVFDQSEPKGTERGLVAEVTFERNRLLTYVVKPVIIRNTVPRLPS
jgi:poly-gamma-glutamate capsule biosynthesis protein CapA/YwtB (metallophosphatase superfamily)